MVLALVAAQTRVHKHFQKVSKDYIIVFQGLASNTSHTYHGMTDTMGRMHSDAQFAGSSSVPAHVEMMGFLGMGNNPMVGATVAIAVAIDLAINK